MSTAKKVALLLLYGLLVLIFVVVASLAYHKTGMR